MIFKHFLNFIDPPYGRIEIPEPSGFDSSTFAVEQESQRFARDVTIGNEEIDEIYWNAIGRESEIPTELNNGELIYYLTHQFEKLAEAYRVRGFETQIQRIIQLDGVDFVTGLMDFATAKYNGRNEFRCKTIQDLNRAIFKRREDVEVDIFSSLDLDGNYSAPCRTQKVLLKAKPVFQKSVLDSTGVTAVPSVAYVDRPSFFNGIKNVVELGIYDTLSWLDNQSSYNPTLDDYDGTPWGYMALKAREELTDVTVLLKLNLQTQHVSLGDSRTRGVFMVAPEVDNLSAWEALNLIYPKIPFYDTGILGGGTGVYQYSYNGDILIQIPNIKAGQILYFFFEHISISDTPTSVVTGFGVNTAEFSATSTAIDSVIDAVWVYDALSKCVNMTTDGKTLNAPLFAPNGIHHDQMIVNGLLLRQAKDFPFLLKPGEVFKSVTQEVCCDYKIRANDIQIKRRDDFYPNLEAAVLYEYPSEDASGYINPRYQLQKFGFGYKTYEQERSSKDTLDEVHTDASWLFPSKMVDEELKITISHFRGAFKFEELRKQAVTAKDNTSLSDDNNYGILDVVQLAPGTVRTISRTLTMLAGGNTLKILSDGTFNWTLLGIGSTLKITQGNNSGNYTVISIEPNTITLSTSSFLTFTGSDLIKIEFQLSGVLWTNRTNQEFQKIEGVKSPTNYSNLQYSIGRNIRYWFKHLATAALFNKSQSIKCTSFKNSKKNGNLFIPNLDTIFRNGAEIIDNSDIPVISLGVPEITPFIEQISLKCSFNEMLEMCKNIEEFDGYLKYIRADGSEGKGYIVSMTYIWVQQRLDCKLELKNTEYSVYITKVSGKTFIIDNPYSDNQKEFVFGWFEMSGEYVEIFNSNRVSIITPTPYKEISINGVTYNNAIDFMDAMNILR